MPSHCKSRILLKKLLKDVIESDSIICARSANEHWRSGRRNLPVCVIKSTTGRLSPLMTTREGRNLGKYLAASSTAWRAPMASVWAASAQGWIGIATESTVNRPLT